MQDVYKSLLELQTLDAEIEQAKTAVESFGPKLDSVEAPLQALERETESLRGKMGQIRQLPRPVFAPKSNQSPLR